MKLFSRIVFLSMILLCLSIAYLYEFAQVYNLKNDKPFDTFYSPYQIVEQSTYDGWILYHSKPFDRNSLVPATLSLKHCVI